jgi:hypothetical protein
MMLVGIIIQIVLLLLSSWKTICYHPVCVSYQLPRMRSSSSSSSSSSDFRPYLLPNQRMMTRYDDKKYLINQSHQPPRSTTFGIRNILLPIQRISSSSLFSMSGYQGNEIHPTEEEKAYHVQGMIKSKEETNKERSILLSSHHHHKLGWSPNTTPTIQMKTKNTVLSFVILLSSWLFFVSFLSSFSPVTWAVSGGGFDYAGTDISGQDFSNGNYKGKDFTQGMRFFLYCMYFILFL